MMSPARVRQAEELLAPLHPTPTPVVILVPVAVPQRSVDFGITCQLFGTYASCRHGSTTYSCYSTGGEYLSCH